MKDFVNPALLFIVIALIAFRVVADGEETASALDISLMTICVTGVVVDGALGLARALARRPSVKNVMWAGGFFVLGCFAWTLRSINILPGEEKLAYQEMYQTHRQNPLQRDEEGENLLTRAAALGEAKTVQDILNEANPSDEDIKEAGIRAAESNQTRVLDLLAGRGMDPKAAVQGTPLLHAAAQNKACEAMEWLLLRGVNPNTRDSEGTTAMIHAVIADSVPAVQLLLEYGADARLKDTNGQSPADYARSEEMKDLLDGPNDNE